MFFTRYLLPYARASSNIFLPNVQSVSTPLLTLSFHEAPPSSRSFALQTFLHLPRLPSSKQMSVVSQGVPTCNCSSKAFSRGFSEGPALFPFPAAALCSNRPGILLPGPRSPRLIFSFLFLIARACFSFRDMVKRYFKGSCSDDGRSWSAIFVFLYGAPH